MVPRPPGRMLPGLRARVLLARNLRRPSSGCRSGYGPDCSGRNLSRGCQQPDLRTLSERLTAAWDESFESDTPAHGSRGCWNRTGIALCTARPVSEASSISDSRTGPGNGGHDSGPSGQTQGKGSLQASSKSDSAARRPLLHTQGTALALPILTQAPEIPSGQKSKPTFPHIDLS